MGNNGTQERGDNPLRPGEVESGNPAARSMSDAVRDWTSRARGRSHKTGTAHDVGGLATHIHDLVAKFEEPRRLSRDEKRTTTKR